MAENKTINIKINSNTKEATKDTQDYNKAIGSTKKQYDAVLKSGDSYEKQLSDINKIVKETPLNVRDMNKQIQAYQSIALSAGRETPVGKDALKKAAELRDRYIDIQNETKRLADDQKNLQGAMQLMGTGIAVYGGVQSAMALSGVESEKLRETMVKLQAAQTLMNSVNTIATNLEKESSAMLLLKSMRTKAVTAATAAYGLVTGTTTGALKLFRIALVSTGIGALVVGLGLLIANFDKVKKAVTNAISNFDKLGPVMNVILFPITAIVEGFKLMKKGLVAFGIIASDEENQAEKRAAASKKRFDEENVRIQKAKENLEKRAKQEKAFTQVYLGELELRRRKAIQNGEDVQAIDDEILQGKIDGIEKEKKKFLEGRILELKRLDNKLSQFKKHSAAYNWQVNYNAEFRKQIANEEFDEVKLFNQQIEGLRVDDVDKDKDALKTKRDNYKNYAQERLNAARKIEDLENSLMEDGIEKDLAINEDKFKRLLEDTKKNTKLTAKERKELNDLYTEQQEQSELKIKQKYDKIDEDREKKRLANIEKLNNDFLQTIENIAEQNYQNTLSDQERELLAVQDKYFALQEAAKGNADALNEIEIARLNEENNINLKYQDEADKNQKASDEKTKADALANQQAKVQFANDSLSAISGLVTSFAGESEKAQERAFKINKAIGITQAIINTAGAVTAAINPAVGGLGIPAGLPGALLAAATGAAQIATISKTQFQGGGSESIESPPGSVEAATPQFNVVGDSGVNQLAQLQQQPTQAYVVSGEVTTSQALDRNRVQNATL